MSQTFRVAVIGATGKGDYGHGLELAFHKLPGCELVALADEQPAGRERTAQRLGIRNTYADYRQMLDREKPHVVCVTPRWLTDRGPMLEACAVAGANIYCEKPCLADLASVDAVRAAVRKADVRLAVAHLWRGMPPVQQAIAQIKAGKFGRVLRMRARPKDDRRGGGEELLIHGTHWFDLMFAIAGPPRWVSAHIAVGARDAEPNDRRQGSEPCGPVAGDNILAVYGFDRGVRGTFDSTANTAPSSRATKPAPDAPRATGGGNAPAAEQAAWDSVYGLTIECEQATLQLRQPGDVFIYPAPGVLPDIEALAWRKLWVEEWHFTPEHQPRPLAKEWLPLANRALALDLLEAIRARRDPLSPLAHAAWIAEMVQGAYASHFAGGRRLAIPLADRKHPLAGD